MKEALFKEIVPKEIITKEFDPQELLNYPIRVAIQDGQQISGMGFILTGRVQSGTITIGDSIIINPAGIEGEIKIIAIHGKEVKSANPLDNIAVRIKGLGKDQEMHFVYNRFNQLVTTGQIISHKESACPVAKEFIAQVYLSKNSKNISKNFKGTLFIHTGRRIVEITQILAQLDNVTHTLIKENLNQIDDTDSLYIVTCKCDHSIALETIKNNPLLGRFAVQMENNTVLIGAILYIKQT